MLTLTPQLIVSTATAVASWHRQEKLKNVVARRRRVDRARGESSLRFVHFVGFWSHYTSGRDCSSWPLPWAGGIGELATFAARHRVIAESPRAGDVFLLASVDRASGYSLAGIVVAVETVSATLNGRSAFVCITAEGELQGTVASPRVPAARLVRRRLLGVFDDLFIRWCDLPAAHVTLAGKGERAGVRYEVPDTLLTLKPVQRESVA